MAGTRKLTLQIFGNAKGATDALKATGDSATSMGKKIANSMPSLKQMALATAAVGAAAAVLGKKFVDMGSNLQESLSKVDVVFGDSAKAIKDFAASSAKSLGISEQAALEAAGTYGNLLRAFGLTQPMATEMSTSLVTLAADLASFNNTSVDDAILALRSGLSGETEPLKKYGIALTDVRLKEQAAAMGLGQFTGQLPIAIKSQAAYALIMKDSTLAQGDFARTSDGVANQQRIISAQFKDVGAQIGTALIPAFSVLLSVVSTKVLPVLVGLSDALRTGGLGGGMQFVADKIKIGVPIVVAALVDFVEKSADWIVTTGFPMFTAAIGRMATALIGWIEPRVPVIIEGLKDFFSRMLKWVITTGLPALVDVLQKVGDKMTSWISLAARELPAQLITFFGDLGKWLLSDGIPILLGLLAKLTGSLIKWTATIGGSLIVGIGGAIVALVAALPDLFVGFFKGLGNIAIGAVKFFVSKFDDMKKALANIAIGAVNALIRAFNSIPLIPNIPEITIDTKKLGSQMGLTGNDLIQVSKKFDSLGGAAVVAAGATTTLDVAAEELGSTLGGGGGGGGGTKKKLDDVVEKLKKYSDAVKSSVSSTKSATDSTKAVTKAREDLSKATDKVTAAQEYFDQVVRGYGKGSKQATDADRDRAKAARDSERAGYGLEGATQAVKTAEKALEDIRSNVDATPEEIREAEIALAEAKLSVADAIDAQYESTIALKAAESLLIEVTDGAKESSITYKSAIDELNEAKALQVDANERVADSIDRETEAIHKLREAEEALALVRGTTSAAIQARVDQSGNVNPAASGSGVTGNPFTSTFRNAMLEAIPFAKGGVVTRPTLGLIGESGAEAVIPLDRLGAMGSTQISITVNAGMGTDGRLVGDEIVRALKQYERLNGYLPLTAQAVV